MFYVGLCFNVFMFIVTMLVFFVKTLFLIFENLHLFFVNICVKKIIRSTISGVKFCKLMEYSESESVQNTLDLFAKLTIFIYLRCCSSFKLTKTSLRQSSEPHEYLVSTHFRSNFIAAA